MVIVMTMEREEMVMFEPMVAQEEVVWTNHDGPLHFTFTKIQDVSSHFFFILHSPSLWFSWVIIARATVLFLAKSIRHVCILFTNEE